MTDYKSLSDSELTEALNFHRRQRNMSRGINEAAHMRQTQVVRLLEAEEVRRLNEEKPNHYVIYKHKDKYGVSQDIGTGYNWDHSYHHGYHDTIDSAKAWAAKHAGKYPHKIEVKEEVDLEEAVTVDKKNYSWGKMMTVRHGSSHSFPLHPEHQEKIKNLKDGESTSFTDETRSKVTAKREGDKVHLSTGGAGHSKTTVAHSHFTEEAEIDEQIKGWKHAASDLSKMRAAKGKNVKLVSLKKDGTESKMHDATKAFGSEEEAQRHHDRVTELNPKSKIRHNMYVDGKHVKTLGEEVEINEAAMDKNHPIVKEYQAMKKHDIKTLRGMIAGQRRIIDTSEFKTKDHAISSYLRDKHGNKAVDKAFGFNEEVEQIDEISYRDSGAQNMMRASRKADKEADKMRAQQAKAAAKAAAKKVVTKEEVEVSEANALGWSFKVTTKKHGPHEVTVSRSAAKSVDDAEQYIKKHPMYVKHKPTKIEYVKEEAEQIDEISTELKKRYVEKGGQDVVDRFTGRGKYEKPRNPAHFTKTGRVKKSALNRPEAVKYREKLDNRRDIVNKVSQEVHGKKRFGEEFELDESKHYLVGTTGNNLTGHTSQPHFNSHDDAMSYQKKFKHVPAIKKAKIVKGTSDKHGFVTPVNEEVVLKENPVDYSRNLSNKTDGELKSLHAIHKNQHRIASLSNKRDLMYHHQLAMNNIDAERKRRGN